MNKIDFKTWLQKFNKTYSNTNFNTLEKVFSKQFITPKNINKILDESKVCAKSKTIALRVWLNFCEEKELITFEKIELIRKRIKLENKSNVDSYVPTNQEIECSLSYLEKNYSKECCLLYKLLIESGIRFTEAEYFVKNFVSEKIEYHEGVAIYRNFYLRGKKSSFYIFCRTETMNEIIESISSLRKINFDYFKKKVSLNEDIVNLKYLRKYNFSLMIKLGINLEVANFIQGRSSSNIGFVHYLEKKEIALREYKKLEN